MDLIQIYLKTEVFRANYGVTLNHKREISNSPWLMSLADFELKICYLFITI